jgi:hypothetical protein
VLFNDRRDAAGAGGLHRAAHGLDVAQVPQPADWQHRLLLLSDLTLADAARSAGCPALGRRDDHRPRLAWQSRQVTVIGFDFNRSKTFYETRTLPSPHDFAAEGAT